MPEEDKPIANAPAEPVAPEMSAEEAEQEMGDFITRHVLEKDSVFFEG